MRIKVEFASGRAVSGAVLEDDAARLWGLTKPGPTALPTQGWITLVDTDADNMTAVNLALAETITELPE